LGTPNTRGRNARKKWLAVMVQQIQSRWRGEKETTVSLPDAARNEAPTKVKERTDG
jgi:hypothetical protein